MGPWGERLEPGKPPEATPASGFMLALRTSPRAGQMRVRGHWSAHVGEPGWPGRGRGQAGGCPVALAGRLFIVGESWAAGASPLHPP